MPQSALNSSLARRLAEAADGLRDGKYYYFVCKTGFPFDLHPVPGDSDNAASAAADTLLNELGSPYQKFGPYQTSSDGSTQWDYDSMELRFLKNGDVVHTQAFEKDVDAIILSLAAYEKFLEPYYARLYGLGVASNFREAAQGALTASTFQIPPYHSGLTIHQAGNSSIEQ